MQPPRGVGWVTKHERSCLGLTLTPTPALAPTLALALCVYSSVVILHVHTQALIFVVDSADEERLQEATLP